MFIRNIRALGWRRLLWTWASAGTATAPAKQAIKNVAKVNAATAKVEIATGGSALAISAAAKGIATGKAGLAIFVYFAAVKLPTLFGVR
jgi:hypothetical protein